MTAANTDKLRKLKSNFATTLNGGITDSDTTITLNAVTGLPTDTAITLTIDRVDANGVALNTVERVTGVVSGSTLVNCLRGEDGTTAQAHNNGAIVEYIWEAETYNDMVDWGLVEHDQDGTHDIITYTALKQNLVTAADGATVTFNCDTSNIFTVTLEGNRTLAVSNADAGQCFVVRLVQDGTGGRTVTWFSTIKWAAGEEPTLTATADKTDVFGFICTGTDTYDGFTIDQNL